MMQTDRADFLIVGIGASAGGLDAARKLMDVLPGDGGMAFILIQHLDPMHESMMVDLLAGHTSMTVVQAIDGMRLAPDHVYVIPPGNYLSVAKGTVRLSRPTARHGPRLPFDFMLHSLAIDAGKRAVCVVLSGTGADGSLGLAAIKEHHGFVIAQNPAEAAYDGMPRSAILTEAVDLVLPISQIPDALKNRARAIGEPPLTDISSRHPAESTRAKDPLAAIIDLVRDRTAHDFSSYKPGNLQRRIERRMTMAAIPLAGLDRYRDMLEADPRELGLLVSDLLINVTSFFRDSQVFSFLATRIAPELLRDKAPGHTLRLWIAGCSSGEEAYSLAMLFREAIAAARLTIKLQIFASDVDAEAITIAREGFYPETIEAEVSAERLARFFSREEGGYRVLPDLRSAVVFTVHDVLGDPPFSRIDMVSCRNLLIYLRPEAQAKVLALFRFALQEDGILLLGNAETVGASAGRFELISKSERVYRHVGPRQPGEFSFATTAGDPGRLARAGAIPAPSRQVSLADLCRRIVTETYAPAAVLINRRYECLFSLGPTDRYLSVATGHSSHDVLAMTRPALRTKLRAAIQQASQGNARVVVQAGRMDHQTGGTTLSIAVHPLQNDGEDLLLVCFVEEAAPIGTPAGQPAGDSPEVAELEHELEATRTELQSAIRNLEASSQEQKAIHEEALSINEEYQSTNEELLASKEELQSLNEELTALNGQLHETLDRQRTTSNDLQNIFYSIDIATLFLDVRLDIRFFTPATKAVFNLIPGDIGRPLSDLNSLADDDELLTDAGTTLRTLEPVAREVRAKTGAWYLRRVLPYRTRENEVEGVVITFTDITERKRADAALEAAKREAEMANLAKSRFLAAASHDLRQPLQSLALIQGLLVRKVEGEAAQKLVALLDPTLSAMSGMLNTLLDINQIDAGTIRPEITSFPIDDMLGRLRDEFTYHAQAQGLVLRSVPCSMTVRSDPLLLEQIVRNLLSNALKYTTSGTVLLGCRRRPDLLSIEIWDTGIGIPDNQIEAIFGEYHQLDNAARERGRGLGLGLSIVRRLADLLGHHVRVRSNVGKGSMFAVEVMRSPAETAPGPEKTGPRSPGAEGSPGAQITRRAGTILVIDDDPELRDLLDLLLTDEGHRAVTVADGMAALDIIGRGVARPDLILADYNLPGGMDGVRVAALLRQRLHRKIPVIILTGDISADTVGDIAGQDCVQLNKPVRPDELATTIQTLLPPPEAPLARAGGRAVGLCGIPAIPVIFIVDDDRHIRDGLRGILEQDGMLVEDYASCEAFLEAYRPGGEGCLLVDAYLPGMHGLQLLQTLSQSGDALPAIMITGDSDVSTAVLAMKAGASDFIEKPIGADDLLASVRRALQRSRQSGQVDAWRQTAIDHLASLTTRQREIMDLVLGGAPSKIIAADLGISQRTVESHRASIMRKTGCHSLPALVRMAAAAARQDPERVAPDG